MIATGIAAEAGRRHLRLAGDQRDLVVAQAPGAGRGLPWFDARRLEALTRQGDRPALQKLRPGDRAGGGKAAGDVASEIQASWDALK